MGLALGLTLGSRLGGGTSGLGLGSGLNLRFLLPMHRSDATVGPIVDMHCTFTTGPIRKGTSSLASGLVLVATPAATLARTIKKYLTDYNARLAAP